MPVNMQRQQCHLKPAWACMSSSAWSWSVCWLRTRTTLVVMLGQTRILVMMSSHMHCVTAAALRRTTMMATGGYNLSELLR